MYIKLPKSIKVLLYAALALAGGWLTLRYLLPWLAPFIAALAAAALLEPAVSWLCRRARFQRGAASGVCVLAFLAVVFALIYFLCGRIVSELKGLMERLPEIIGELSSTIEVWRERLSGYLDRGQKDGQQYLQHIAAAVTERIRQLPSWLSGKVLTALTGVAAAMPSVMLFAVTAVIGAYFASASYPALKDFLALQLPDSARVKVRGIAAGLKRTILRWFKAQLLMMLITFGELTAAFLLLRINYALLLALLTAVIDALPVLGTGTVLIPWALYDLLTGEISRGIGLVITYVAVTVLRNCIQAKLLGDQLGLHPLATLLAIYVGFMVSGVWGMILFPILLITLKQLNDSGMIHLWKKPAGTEKGEYYDRNHIQYNSRHGDEHTGRHEYPSR